MVLLVYYLVGGLLLLLIVTILVIRRIKKKKRTRENPPQDLLNKLDELEGEFERRRKQDENTNPYKILWEHARQNIAKPNGRIETRNIPITKPESTISNRELCQQSYGEQDIQNISNTGDKECSGSNKGKFRSNRQPKRNSSGTFFSRFRRRK